jgi:hypothetical protein
VQSVEWGAQSRRDAFKEGAAAVELHPIACYYTLLHFKIIAGRKRQGRRRGRLNPRKSLISMLVSDNSSVELRTNRGAGVSRRRFPVRPPGYL